MKSQWKGSNLENGGWCYRAGDLTGLLWSVEWQDHGATEWRVTAQHDFQRSCHMISLEESALSGPAFCLCHWIYWQIKSSVISGSYTRRNSANSDKSMPGCIIRCWGYQMHVSLKHNPWLVFTVLTTGLLRSEIYHSQACQKCQTAVFQLLLFCCSPSLRCFDQHLHWVWGKSKLFRPFQRE